MNWEDLGAKLAAIAQREGWTYHPPITAEVFATFEADHRVILPEPYARFLREVSGGVETDCMQLVPFSEGAGDDEARFATPFPYDSAYGDAILAALARGRTLGNLAADRAMSSAQVRGLPPGCIVIGELDGVRSVLVITGEERGRVWQIGDFDLPETRHRHTGDGDSARLDFAGWFACWLIENGVRVDP